MSEVTEVVEEQSSALGMSDADFLNQPIGVADAAPESAEGTDDGAEGAGEGEVVSEISDSAASDDSVGDITADSSNPADDISDSDNPDGDKQSDKVTDKIDYKAFHDQITAPFKADGRQMQVDNIDDAIRLMQMGANYNRKMAGMKPGMKILKTLEKNGLLDENKLGFLIDLDKKNPEAIARLLKDSGINPLDVDVKSESKYTAPTYTVDDKELALDTAIDAIRDTDTYRQTINVVGNTWDAASKEIIADAPELLIILNDQMANGVYALIDEQVARQRALGKLNGLSDFAAYKQVGDSIQAANGFDHLFRQEQRQPVPSTESPKPSVKAVDTALNDKRRAAGATKSAVTAEKTSFNPLSMSDEEFLKQAATR